MWLPRIEGERRLDNVRRAGERYLELGRRRELLALRLRSAKSEDQASAFLRLREVGAQRTDLIERAAHVSGLGRAPIAPSCRARPPRIHPRSRRGTRPAIFQCTSLRTSHTPLDSRSGNWSMCPVYNKPRRPAALPAGSRGRDRGQAHRLLRRPRWWARRLRLRLLRRLPPWALRLRSRQPRHPRHPQRWAPRLRFHRLHRRSQGSRARGRRVPKHRPRTTPSSPRIDHAFRNRTRRGRPR